MFAAFLIMFVGGAIGWVGLSVFAFLVYGFSTTSICIFLAACALIFQCFLVFDYQFQAILKARISSLCKSAALLAGIALKVLIIQFDYGIEYVVAAYLFDHVIVAAFLCYLAISNQCFFLPKYNIGGEVRCLLRAALPMTLSAFAIAAYASVDKLFVLNSQGSVGLGLYASATRLVDGVSMLFVVVCVSILPILIGMKKNNNEKYVVNMVRGFAVIFWGGAIGAAAVFFYSKEIMSLLFGDSFSRAEEVLEVSIWSVIFLGFGSLTVRYMIVEGLERYLSFRSMVMVVGNVLFCWLLVPRYGEIGAACSVLISVFLSNYVFDAVFKETRPLFLLKTKAILLIGLR